MFIQRWTYNYSQNYKFTIELNVISIWLKDLILG